MDDHRTALFLATFGAKASDPSAMRARLVLPEVLEFFYACGLLVEVMPSQGAVIVSALTTDEHDDDLWTPILAIDLGHAVRVVWPKGQAQKFVDAQPKERMNASQGICYALFTLLHDDFENENESDEDWKVRQSVQAQARKNFARLREVWTEQQRS